MKIRNGFVSNSSSSSFVIIGYRLSNFNFNDIIKIMKKNFPEKLKEIDPEDQSAIYDLFYEMSDNGDLFGIEGVRVLNDDGDSYIGIVIADIASDRGGIDESEISLSDLTVRVNKLKETLGKTDDPKIISGTRAT